MLIAEKMIEGNMLEQLREERYSGWKGDFGQAMINGELSMEEISGQVLDNKIDPEPSSGRQELLENVVNWYIWSSGKRFNHLERWRETE